MCIIASLLWNLHEQREKILEIAHNSAELTLGKDVIYRRWAARHGGPYVPVSDHTPPNPYLNVPNRDAGAMQGLGLANMRERAELSGGSFVIESVEGKGTITRASWPLSSRMPPINL
jgi:hypothetical protein